MKPAWWLVAAVLTGCQAQGSAATPASPAAGGATTERADVIYVQDSSGRRMLELDWSGKLHGTVSSQGFASPSPDGSLFLRSAERLSVVDWRDRSVGELATDGLSYGLGAWADDGRHFCSIVFPAGTGPDSGRGSLWMGAAGEPGRVIGPVGSITGNPAVAACSIKSNHAIVASGLFPHWPPQATRYLVTGTIEVVNLSTGRVEYQHNYPVEDPTARGIAAAPDWVIVAASPDGHYLAESGIFNGTTTIRETATGREVGHLHGSVRGFSPDGSRVVMSIWKGGTTYEAEIINWSDQQVIWHRDALAQSSLASPHSGDIMIGISAPDGGNPDVVVVDPSGVARTIARAAMVSWPCPCPAGP